MNSSSMIIISAESNASVAQKPFIFLVTRRIISYLSQTICKYFFQASFLCEPIVPCTDEVEKTIGDYAYTNGAEEIGTH